MGQADMPLLSLWGYDKYQKIGNAHGGCLSQSAANRKCYGVKYGNVFSLPLFEISDSGDGQWLVRVSGPLNIHSADETRSRLIASLKNNAVKSVVFDLEQVSAVDEYGALCVIGTQRPTRPF
ncbi:MAG: STAS domain-containing protein [Desulfobacterales bacterium]